MTSDFNGLKRALKGNLSKLPSIRVALVGDTATQLMGTAIRGMGAVRGVRVELFEAEFGQVEQQLLDQNSELYSFAPEFIVLFQSTHKLAELHATLLPERQSSLAEDRLSFIETVVTGTSTPKWIVMFVSNPGYDR